MKGFEQLGMAVFGLTAMWMAMGHSARLRRWAPIVGLAGQPFWAAYAWDTQGWGLAILVIAYSGVYIRGAWLQWRPA